MQILSADIHTQPDGIAWDRFLVEDKQSPGQPSQQRINAILQEIQAALDPRHEYAPVFPVIKGPAEENTPPDFQTQPTQVRFDNSTSEHYTIITLFAYDRLGLLYSVAKVLFELELLLHSAKISTHLDQVVDVFYVSDIHGHKIEETIRLYLIRQRLLQAIGGDEM
jgi:[protein-PII] uridylyltransferase